jgi:dolichol-phosphate mannosyltransferase
LTSSKSIVVLPTYNERENLEEFVNTFRQKAPGVHLLIVDDNSPDGTGKIADRLCGLYPGEIQVLHRPGKLGLGKAYLAGFSYVLPQSYEYILQMDADLSHDPGYIPAFLKQVKECDLVLGSRYVRGIAVVNWDFKRLLLSKGASKYVQFITGMPFSDPTGGFKAWRRDTLKQVLAENVFANGYLFQVEMTYRAFRKESRITELPIIFYERNLGRSKMRMGIIGEAIWGVIRLRLGL